MTTQHEIKEFLSESNHIEGVRSAICLNDAYAAWVLMNIEKEINPLVVMHIHKALMSSRLAWSEPDLREYSIGVLRTQPVYIGGHEAMKWVDLPLALEAWCQKMNATIANSAQLAESIDAVSKELHVEYEAIHPFIDGNGRTGRIFMNWWRLQVGLPLLIIHEGEEQFEYYKWFK